MKADLNMMRAAVSSTAMDDVMLMIAAAFELYLHSLGVKLLVVSTNASFGFNVSVLFTLLYLKQSSIKVHNQIQRFTHTHTHTHLH
jgi:hypothetical protein